MRYRLCRFRRLATGAALLVSLLPIQAQAPDGGIAWIALERQGCYGSCPIYRIQIAGDGQVTYRGRAHVAEVGERSASIPPDEFAPLVEALRIANYPALKLAYRQLRAGCAGPLVADGPSAVITVHGLAEETVIRYDGSCPDRDAVIQRLEGLADMIDRVGNVYRWTMKR